MSASLAVAWIWSRCVSATGGVAHDPGLHPDGRGERNSVSGKFGGRQDAAKAQTASDHVRHTECLGEIHAIFRLASKSNDLGAALPAPAPYPIQLDAFLMLRALTREEPAGFLLGISEIK